MPSMKYKERTYAGASFPCLEVTKAEYEALSEEKKMDGTVYMVTDGTGGWEAENSSYDNTDSGLTATNVQDALDEISLAENSSYDNTDSGLSATNVQDALDEISLAASNTQTAVNGLLSSMTAPTLWTPHIYDNNTKVRELPNVGKCFKFGKICIAWISGLDIDFSGINTMLVFRNLPCSFTFGGSAYFGNFANQGANITIQGSNYLLLRPNMKSSDFSSPTQSGYTTIFFVGYDF